MHTTLLLLITPLLAACSIRARADEFYDKHAPGADATTLAGTTTAAETTGTTTTHASGPEQASSGDTTGTTGDPASATGTSTAATTAPPDTSSTGDPAAPPAVCGDGLVEGDEECDDANAVDIDECDNACARAYFIFVTSEFGYTGKLNGLKGADARCRNRAALAGLPRWDHYSALLSDSTTSAAARLHHARGYYRLINGLPVAHGWHALMNEPLAHPINVTELSTTLDINVWTGTGPGGAAIPGAAHCGDWTIEADDVLGHYGKSGQVGPGWLVWDNPKTNPTVCFANSALYCIEQP